VRKNENEYPQPLVVVSMLQRLIDRHKHLLLNRPLPFVWPQKVGLAQFDDLFHPLQKYIPANE
jgi:hypothetical protein